MRIRVYLLLISMLVFNGCTTFSDQPSSSQVPTSRTLNNRGSKPVFLNPKPSTIHTVQHSDTLYSIAKRHNKSVSELAALNGLSPPYHLKMGQTLRIPPRKKLKK